jgi:hypothetical protein
MHDALCDCSGLHINIDIRIHKQDINLCTYPLRLSALQIYGQYVLINSDTVGAACVGMWSSMLHSEFTAVAASLPALGCYFSGKVWLLYV